MSDFSKDQPKPASPTNDFKYDEAGVPVTGFTEAPKGEQAGVGPGEGIPASNRKIR